MQKFKEFFINSFFCYLAIELVEEMLEELIAFGIASLFIKGLSTLLVVSITQSIKVAIKTLVKKFTYKEGNDKMDKFKQFFTWIKSNKKTILGTASTAVAALSGTGIIDISILPELPVGGFNVTPILYYGVLLVFALIGVFGKGLESIKEFAERVKKIKAEKEKRAIEKEAKAELKAEEKAASQTQAEKEKADAKKAADEKAKAEKEQAEKEHRLKIEEAKAKLLAEKASKEQVNN
jgi:hypothetical protein